MCYLYTYEGSASCWDQSKEYAVSQLEPLLGHGLFSKENAQELMQQGCLMASAVWS